MFVAIIVCALLCSVRSSKLLGVEDYPETRDALVVRGAGPTGLFLSAQLLSEVEKRNQRYGDVLRMPLIIALDTVKDPWRGPVIRIPYSIAKDLPDSLKRALWPKLIVRQRMFGPQPRDNGTWRITYQNVPLVEIRDFELKLREYLQRTFPEDFQLSIVERSDFGIPVSSDKPVRIVGQFATCGTPGGQSLRKHLREQAELLKFAPGALEQDGLFDDASWDDFLTRIENPLFADDRHKTSRPSFHPGFSILLNPGTQSDGSVVQTEQPFYDDLEQPSNNLGMHHRCGMTYSCANNDRNAVQIYLFPHEKCPEIAHSERVRKLFGELVNDATGLPLRKELFPYLTAFSNSSSHRPPELRARALEMQRFVGAPEPTSDAEFWLRDFREAVLEMMQEIGVLSKDRDELARCGARLHYAKRSESYFKKVTLSRAPVELVNNLDRSEVLNTFHVPILFAGDSAGGTDYKAGLSGGRGLMAVKDTARVLARALWHQEKVGNWTHALLETLLMYQKHWEGIVRDEFGTDIGTEGLGSNENAWFRYITQGRHESVVSQSED